MAGVAEERIRMLEAKDIVFGHGDARFAMRDGRAAPKPLLDGVSLCVDAGERVHLSAPSGAGKTTLCRIMAGYESAWAGKVEADGRPLPKKGACPVQLIGQHPENMLDSRMRMQKSLEEAGWSLRSESDGALLERLGIRDRWLTRYPHELSGGELQRFCIARALLASPRYVIADEMTTMLDTLSQAQIWKVLLEEVETRDAGLLFTTHSQALADRIATRTVYLQP